MNDTPAPTNAAPAGESPAVSTVGTATVPRRKWLTPALALLAVLVIGVFGGILIGHATASTAQASNVGGLPPGFGGGAGGGTGGSAGGAGFAGGGFTSGTIVSITGTTMVVKAKDGTQKTVTTSDTTRVSKTTTTTLSELTAGQSVTVIGAAGSNGDIAATSVSEGALTGGFGGGAPPTGSTK